MTSPELLLALLCRQSRLAALYAFGSRAGEAAAVAKGRRDRLSPGPADLDIGILPADGRTLPVQEKADLACRLEDLFKVGRVDLVVLPEADPFLAANIIRGERLYALDETAADEYDLYILRRAGDLIPLERERIALILGEPT